MIKKETIIADDVFQEFVEIPYQESLLLSCPATNSRPIEIAESKNALDSEVFEIGAGQSITLEWKASRKNTKYWIRGTAGDTYQVITI